MIETSFGKIKSITYNKVHVSEERITLKISHYIPPNMEKIYYIEIEDIEEFEKLLKEESMAGGNKNENHPN